MEAVRGLEAGYASPPHHTVQCCPVSCGFNKSFVPVIRSADFQFGHLVEVVGRPGPAPRCPPLPLFVLCTRKKTGGGGDHKVPHFNLRCQIHDRISRHNRNQIRKYFQPVCQGPSWARFMKKIKYKIS